MSIRNQCGDTTYGGRPPSTKVSVVWVRLRHLLNVTQQKEKKHVLLGPIKRFVDRRENPSWMQDRNKYINSHGRMQAHNQIWTKMYTNAHRSPTHQIPNIVETTENLHFQQSCQVWTIFCNTLMGSRSLRHRKPFFQCSISMQHSHSRNKYNSSFGCVCVCLSKACASHCYWSSSWGLMRWRSPVCLFVCFCVCVLEIRY